MRCMSCMTDNPKGNKFCEQCGTQLTQSCPRCGHDISPSARFCGNCGHGSGIGTAVPEVAPKWGELKQATVLFADVVASTELIAGLGPEEAMARLRPAVLRMRHSVERFGGTVVRTLGDGVMALFGVPRALEGHALLACQAAMHMQKSFGAGADELRVRVGLHSGQVASDPADAEDGRGGGAHGLTIHLASRVIGIAQPGATCITDACRAAAGGACETVPLGLHTLKGIANAIELHELVGIRPQAASRAGPSLGGSTFRGRENEFRVLQQTLDNVGSGGRSVVAVAGDPGAGKSRLCLEFANACRSRGIPLYEVRAQLYGHALPLQPILELFRVHFFGIEATDNATTARVRIAQRFAAVAPADADLELLYEFFGVGSGEVANAFGPRARQARLLALVKELLRAEAQLQRVILIEDLHWLDEGSEEFVSLLVDAVVGTRTFLLLNYRHSYRCPWLELPHFQQIELRELADDDMDSLVDELLAPATRSPEVRDIVCRRAGGNPFFAEELVRSLVESRLLAPDTGLPLGGIEAIERALPATVEAVVGARLDRIGEPEKTLLQMCAIIGKDIPLAVLEHVASPLAGQIERGLEGLCRAGLILPQPADGGRRFAFRHPLIQEVAYGTQFKLRRGQVHAGVAAAMELYYGDRLDEYAGLIGYHFEQAGEHLQAARYNARAAAWVGNTNPAQSIKHWRKVRAVLESVPRMAEVDRLRATAGGKIAMLGWREGMTLQEVKPLIDDALALANQVDDRLVPWLLTIEGRMLVASGGPADGYVDCVKKALLYIDIDKDAGRVAVAHAFLTQAYAWAGLLTEALAANDTALDKAAHVDPFDREFIGFNIEQWVLSVRSRLLARMGRVDDARVCLERVLQLEGNAVDAPIPGMSSLGSIELAWALEDAELAALHAGELQATMEKHATPYLRSFTDGYRGMAFVLAGEHERAVESLQRALTNVRTTGAATEFETEILALLAECQLRMGDYEAAHAVASEAIRLSRMRSTRIAECRARIVRGAAAGLMAGGSQDAAQVDFDEAEALIRQTGALACAAALQRARDLQLRTSSVISRKP